MAHLAAVRSRLDTSTVAEVARPSAMSWPTVASMAALGASRLGWLISSPKQLNLPAGEAAIFHFQQKHMGALQRQASGARQLLNGVQYIHEGQNCPICSILLQ